jgi:hypothetical protein
MNNTSSLRVPAGPVRLRDPWLRYPGWGRVGTPAQAPGSARFHTASMIDIVFGSILFMEVRASRHRIHRATFLYRLALNNA